MLETIITSSLLILIIIALRFGLRSRLSPGVIYALWAVAALRLLVPVSLASSPVSVMNLFAGESGTAEEYTAKNYIVDSEGTIIYLPSDIVTIPAPQTQPLPEVPTGEQEASAPKKTFSDRDALTLLWLGGCAVTLGAVVFRNLRLYFSLRKRREAMEDVSSPLPVYVAKGIGSPFLFGFPVPGIYMNPYAAEDRRRAGYVITHELMHYAHLDHIWAVVRVICVSVYWFNPLVWLAAYLSRQDSELACDSAVIRAVGEEYGIDYGRTLVDMVNVRFSPTDAMLTSTTMSSDVRSIRERLVIITRRPETMAWAAVTAGAIIALTAAVTFTGAGAAPPEKEFVYPESMTALPLSQLPDDLYCTVYDHDNPLNDVSASIRTSRELNLINHILLEAHRNHVSPEEIPSESWIAASFQLNGSETYQITNDGYVIMRKEAGVQEPGAPFFVDTDNIAAGTYYEGFYGFFRIPEVLFGGLIGELKAICEEYALATPGGVGSYDEQAINVIYAVTNGGEDVYCFDMAASEVYSVIPFSLSSSCWRKESAGRATDPAPAPGDIALRLIFDRGTDVFDFTRDGRVCLRYISDDMFSDPAMAASNPAGTDFAQKLEGYLTDRCDIYTMPKGTYDTIMQAAGEAIEEHESGHLPVDGSLYPDMLAQFSTFYNEENTGRAQNLAVAAEYISGTVLAPGESFSFNDIVGMRTPDRGFVKASAYAFENLSEDYGGGISQAATTLYNAAVCAGLEITEHHNHLYTVDYTAGGDLQFFGNDACVEWGKQDLCFVNSKEHPVTIIMTCDANTLTAYIFGTDDGVRVRLLHEETELTGYDTVFKRPTDHSVNRTGQYGRTVTVYRAVIENGEYVSQEPAYTVTYLPLTEIVYTSILPDGIEYDVVYKDGSFPSGDYFDPNEVWAAPEYAFLLEGVPVPECGRLIYHALHREGVEVTEHGKYDLLGTVPSTDLLVLMFEDIDHGQRMNYIDELKSAGFTYFADDGSGTGQDMCVLYNAPAHGVGVQIDVSGGPVIFFRQGDGCYGYSEHIPKG